MLLQALYQYATQNKLLDNLPFQRRLVHLAIPLRRDGTLRGDGLVLFTTRVRKGKAEKEEIGEEVWLPRFPGENNGGKAYYLADHIATVFGLRKDSVTKDGIEIAAGDALPSDAEDRKDRNPVMAFRHFWERIEAAFSRTRDEDLAAILEFRRRYSDGFLGICSGAPVYRQSATPQGEGAGTLYTDRSGELAADQEGERRRIRCRGQTD